MRPQDTQIGKIAEQIKLAMLAHTPIVYIPTNQLELIQDLLFGEGTRNALMPRVRYDANENATIVIPAGEFGAREETGEFKPISDNYIFEPSEDFYYHEPAIFVKRATSWKDVISYARKFISLSIGLKSSSYPDPQDTYRLSHSVFIIIMPQEETVPADLAPYVEQITVDPLTDEEISQIIENELLEQEIILCDEESMDYLIVNLRGFSNYKIRQIINKSLVSELITCDGTIREDSIRTLIRAEKKQLLEKSIGLNWESTAGQDASAMGGIIKWISDRSSVFNDITEAKNKGIDIPKGILVSGIPGSGKSLIARQIARIFNNCPLISLDMGALRGGIQGESEHNMINALKTAESMAPCVLWIDEIEKAFSGTSGSSESDAGVGLRMFGKFLTWLQEKKEACFVFATANDITNLPPELFRSERFDKKFFTFMPTFSECCEIFAKNIEAQNKAYNSVNSTRLLFEKTLAKKDTWKEILNDECCVDDVQLCDTGKWDPRTLNGKARPQNKLLTGADISAIIKEAKILSKDTGEKDYVFSEKDILVAVKEVIKSFKPYGETNLGSIVTCFQKLYENQFSPASTECIINFEAYDDEMRRYAPKKYLGAKYDEVLYNTIVGAINRDSLSK